MIYDVLARMSGGKIEKYPVPTQLLPYLDCNVRRIDLPIRIETEQYLDIALRAYAKHNGWLKGNGVNKNYLGLGIQYNDEKNPVFDCVPTIGRKRYVEDGITPSSFSKLNEIGREFAPLIEAFAQCGVKVVRGRLLKSLPGQAAIQHYDLDYRIHIPIMTNPHAKAIFGDEKTHMPLGGMYLHNGFRQHSFENLGETERIHLVFVVAGLTLESGFDVTQEQFACAIAPGERIERDVPMAQIAL